MIKKEMNRGYYSYILEYDDTRFDIKYCKFSYSFILLNKDGSVLCDFPRSIGFIKQVDVGDKTYFVVSNHSNSKTSDKKTNSLEQLLVVDKPVPTVEVCECSSIESVVYDDIVLSDSSFLLSSDKGLYVYSLSKDLKSRVFQKVYKDDKYIDVIGTNTIVEEMIVASTYRDVPDIYDVITYGIDPVTLKVKTKIYSKNQNKYIDLYSEEKASRVSKESSFLASKGLKSEASDLIGTTTIVNEILRPLEEQAKYKCFILSDVNDNEKSEFIKKLGNKEG